MNKTPIEWTDYTWNPVTGCSKISQGCKHCYADTMNTRFGKGRKFTDVKTHPERLNEPIDMNQKITGKRVFVCDVSDLFHKDVPFDFIASVYAVMATRADVTFQVLTKRPDRALEFYQWCRANVDKVNKEIAFLNFSFPPANVWIGVSVEDQKAADERIPFLLQIPAAVRFLSCEPLIGRLEILKHLLSRGDTKRIHWVIAGGESGNRKTVRPMHPDWVRSLRDECKIAGVPFFFKQWGNYIPYQQIASDLWQSSQTQCTFNAIDMNEMTPKAKQIVDDGILYRKRDNSMCKNYIDGAQHLEFPINN